MALQPYTTEEKALVDAAIAQFDAENTFGQFIHLVRSVSRDIRGAVDHANAVIAGGEHRFVAASTLRANAKAMQVLMSKLTPEKETTIKNVAAAKGIDTTTYDLVVNRINDVLNEMVLVPDDATAIDTLLIDIPNYITIPSNLL